MRNILQSAGIIVLLVGAANAYEWQALPDAPPILPGNPQSAAKIALGKQLFFDPRFSASISCDAWALGD